MPPPWQLATRQHSHTISGFRQERSDKTESIDKWLNRTSAYRALTRLEIRFDKRSGNVFYDWIPASRFFCVSFSFAFYSPPFIFLHDCRFNIEIQISRRSRRARARVASSCIIRDRMHSRRVSCSAWVVGRVSRDQQTWPNDNYSCWLPKRAIYRHRDSNKHRHSLLFSMRSHRRTLIIREIGKIAVTIRRINFLPSLRIFLVTLHSHAAIYR